MMCAYVTTYHRTPAGQWRTRRHAREAAELRRDLRYIIVAHPRLRLLGSDPFVECLARKFGLDPVTLAISAVRVDARTITIVAANARIWRSEKWRSNLLELKRAAQAKGHFVMLVPRRVIRREPRFSAARLIAAHKDVKVSPDDTAAIVHHVITSPASLWSCSEVVRDASSKLGCVLALISQGVLVIRLDQALTPSSPVQLNTSRPPRPHRRRDHRGNLRDADRGTESL